MAEEPTAGVEIEEPRAKKQEAGKPIVEKPTKPAGMAGLKIVLWVSGLVFMFFGSWAFLARETIEGIFNSYGKLIGDEYVFSGGPMEMYVLRITLMGFLVFGVFLIVAAINPVRFRVLVTFAIVMSGVYMVFAPIAGEMDGVGLRWYALDAAPALLMFVLLLVFSRRARLKAKAETAV